MAIDDVEEVLVYSTALWAKRKSPKNIDRRTVEEHKDLNFRLLMDIRAFRRDNYQKFLATGISLVSENASEIQPQILAISSPVTGSLTASEIQDYLEHHQLSKTPEIAARALEMHLFGSTLTEIAEELNSSAPTIYRVIDRVKSAILQKGLTMEELL